MSSFVGKTLGKAESAGVIEKIPKATPEGPKATRAQTVAAEQRLASRRSRGFSRGLLSYDRTLGSQSPLQGEEINS